MSTATKYLTIKSVVLKTGRRQCQDLLAPVGITVSLTIDTSQSEVQELRVAADYQREVQSILVKAFGQDGLASATAVSEFAEQQLVTIEVRRTFPPMLYLLVYMLDCLRQTRCIGRTCTLTQC